MAKPHVKYSIALPTRNRLEYLKYAVLSVIKQNYADWELIISDNASEENIQDYILALKEPRIKYSRSEKFLSVTESWNRSIDLCTGDYIIMLGDDDILLKNYFGIADKLLENHQQPDLIYTNSYLYTYPGVMPNLHNGMFQPLGALSGMPKNENPFCLELSERLAIVQGTLNFCTFYATNMQHVLIHRSLVERVKKENKFFHSPYPDIYAMSALFIEAKKVLICPKEMVVVGVTPKSHGYYFLNEKQQEAVDFLNVKNAAASIPGIQHLLLPPYNSFHSLWFAAIHLLNNYFPLVKYGLKINYKKYRNEQLKNFSRLYFKDKKTFKNEYKKLNQNLTYLEKLLQFYPAFLFICMKKLAPKFLKDLYKKIKAKKTAPDAHTPGYPKNRFSSILEIFDQIEPKL